ncbi:MAG TPA: mannose-1-phosphate guanylyltransferase, partial [Pirellulales bacterium]|nr:mannose-1-phosphate guanylyltransferase [Pirellulales bacterium]
MLHAIIMAGGSGTRFWPESRDLRPKQLLRFAGDRSMIQATVDRLEGLLPPERMLIATNAKLVEVVARQLPELPAESILGEPCKRDTAPCIGLAALIVSRHDAEATMAVMPSDHVIGPDAAFRQAIAFAAALVDESPARIVTFGIKPTYPAESFGYIERGERLATQAAAKFQSLAPAYQVRQFREKPKAEVAKGYVESGHFYWNSGIFVWRATTILEALRQRQPEMFEHLERISQAFGQPGYEVVFAREFAAIRGVSIDYAVMEHAKDVAVIEAPYHWDDVGS